MAVPSRKRDESERGKRERRGVESLRALQRGKGCSAVAYPRAVMPSSTACRACPTHTFASLNFRPSFRRLPGAPSTSTNRETRNPLQPIQHRKPQNSIPPRAYPRVGNGSGEPKRAISIQRGRVSSARAREHDATGDSHSGKGFNKLM